MLTVKEYSSIINSWIADIKYPSSPRGLYEPIAYMLAGGGKRIRPTLLCASAEALGLPCSGVQNQAIGIEMFHNFTLLHDDLMDDADVRHGVATVHKKWNDAAAILSGDTMLTLASIYMAKDLQSSQCEILELFNKTAVEIYEGQQLDMNFENSDDVSSAEYIEMIRLKTAVLLGCACKIGAMIAGSSRPVCDSLYDYGVNLGLAFQLRDDYLDTFGDETTFGKAIGGDIVNNKKTWLWVDACNFNKSAILDAAIISDHKLKIETVTALYRSCRSDMRCREEIERYTNLALQSLECTRLSADAEQFFKDIATAAITRDH